MKSTLIHIGPDFDDTQFHGSALDGQTGEVLDFNCRPSLKALPGQLETIGKRFPGSELRLCYEASIIGYILQRDLADKGYHRDVVAPTSIPHPRGKPVRTDRIDAVQLAQFYAKGLLTFVNVPAAQTEQDRDLLRSRQKLLQQQTELRKHMQSLLRRNGLHYKARHKTKPIGQITPMAGGSISEPRRRFTPIKWGSMRTRSSTSRGKIRNRRGY